MKLRQALKVFHNIGTREDCYKKSTLDTAMAKYESLPSSKATTEYWHALMKQVGPEGRAHIIERSMPGDAFKILCEQVEGLSFNKE